VVAKVSFEEWVGRVRLAVSGLTDLDRTEWIVMFTWTAIRAAERGEFSDRDFRNGVALLARLSYGETPPPEWWEDRQA